MSYDAALQVFADDAIPLDFQRLDRRLTSLEKELLELRNRVDRMEKRYKYSSTFLSVRSE